ncbi:protein singed-like isoform X2 [Amphibalanus amphitrite]|uniref:protein singed-like isoform X2 n=1 Tax=Amphibalanus amphitrite TaxID=1232801 RepID=UPI001C91D36C|nr:protein singed-like isoform X2 [Amphibalanus amphitrite]
MPINSICPLPHTEHWEDLHDMGFIQPFMDKMNGSSNGMNGGTCEPATDERAWTVGLLSGGKYLTAETFGFKINANGTSLKKKQLWTMQPTGDAGQISLRSHLGKYLAVDSFGNVTCESDELEAGGVFEIALSTDGSGRWALKNVERKYFLGSAGDKLVCNAKAPADSELWYVHLAARPQVNLYSLGRKRFAHLSEDQDEIHVDANIPWGEDTLFTLEFRDNHYALHTCNNLYLHREGGLQSSCAEDCLFSIEYHNGSLALRDRTGKYLSPVGSKAQLKSRGIAVTKDELFTLENSLPQACFSAALNDRYVSVKQGIDVTANQEEVEQTERFLLEFDPDTRRWYIRTMQDRYWTLESSGGIQAAAGKKSSNSLFDLVWHGDGSVSLRANNGKCLSAKKSGHLFANSEENEENAKFYFYLINRPILVLKCDQGFVGYKSSSSTKLECNKTNYETVHVERGDKGRVFFKGQNGKYWTSEDGISASGDVPHPFFMELREPTRMCIKDEHGGYLCAQKNGAFALDNTDVSGATYWEF